METSQYYLEQLVDLASSVPDLASTWSSPTDQSAEHSSLSFLRSSSTQIRQPSRSSTRGTSLPGASLPNVTAFSRFSGDSQRRMRRAIAQTRRYTPAQLQELGDSREVSHGWRRPYTDSGYQGWAPGSSDHEAEVLDHHLAMEDRLRVPSDEDILWRQSPEQISDPVEEQRPVTNEESWSRWGQSHFAENAAEAEPTVTESSLRTTALLQAVRRHSRFSPRSRNYLENYILERERHSNNGSGHNDNHGRRNQDVHSSYSSRLQRHHIDLTEEADDSHPYTTHGMTVDQPRTPSRPSRSNNTPTCLEKCIKYLEQLNFCESHAERIRVATICGFIRDDKYIYPQDDFILDTRNIAKPHETSWLKPGVVFSGSQHAAAGSSPSHLANLIRNSPHRSELRALSSQRDNEEGTRHPSRTGAPKPDTNDERWPVKVTVHSMNDAEKTLCGTMEALWVPDRTSPTKKSSITTYLEGEIIDFDNFTLQTKTYKAGAQIDATYWRKLAPFRDMFDDEIARNLTSKKFHQEALSARWVLMRWKGKST